MLALIFAQNALNAESQPTPEPDTQPRSADVGGGDWAPRTRLRAVERLEVEFRATLYEGHSAFYPAAVRATGITEARAVTLDSAVQFYRAEALCEFALVAVMPAAVVVDVSEAEAEPAPLPARAATFTARRVDSAHAFYRADVCAVAAVVDRVALERVIAPKVDRRARPAKIAERVAIAKRVRAK